MAEQDPIVHARRQALIDDDTILRDVRCEVAGERPGARCGRESEFVVAGVSVCAGHLAQAVRAQLDVGEDPSVIVTSSTPKVPH